jgi:hypothetical protein
MPRGPRLRHPSTIRRDVYRLFLALTRFLIDPLVAGQLPDTAIPDAGGVTISSE